MGLPWGCFKLDDSVGRKLIYLEYKYKNIWSTCSSLYSCALSPTLWACALFRKIYNSSSSRIFENSRTIFENRVGGMHPCRHLGSMPLVGARKWGPVKTICIVYKCKYKCKYINTNKIQEFVSYIWFFIKISCLIKYTGNTRKYKGTQIEIRKLPMTKKTEENSTLDGPCSMSLVGSRAGRLVGWLVACVSVEKVVGQLPCYLSPLRAACIPLTHRIQIQISFPIQI